MKITKANGKAEYALIDALKDGESINSYPGSAEGLIGSPVIAPDKTELECAVRMLRENIKINAKLAVHEFDNSDPGFSVARIRGGLLKKIIDDIKDYDPHKLSTLAYSLTMFGTKLETVKLGLLLLVLFDFADDEVVRKHLITLGLYEEFTSYVISNVRGWPDEIKNHVFFVYAQRLSGWGKINAMEFLEPESNEIREWILCNGCRNDISLSCLARTVYDKSRLDVRLKEGGLNEKEMQGARDIMQGLLDGNQGPGMDSIDNTALLAMRYLKELAEHEITLEDVVNMYELRNYFVNEDKISKPDDKGKTLSIIDRFIGLEDSDGKIRDGVGTKPDLAVPIAAEAGIDIADKLMECVVSDFEGYYKYGYYFLCDSVYVDEFLNLCEKNLIGRDFKEGMGLLTVSPEDENIWMIDEVIRYLDKYPGKGKKLLLTAIGSSILKFRTAAADIIRRWEEVNGANIKKTDPDIFHAIKKIRKKEASDPLKRIWEEILSYK